MKLQPVDPGPNPIRRYARYLTDEQRATIEDARDALRGARLVHLNATATGGGVAEILHSLVPLLSSLGIDARWYVLPADDAFFGVTKQIHNWLQGAPGAPTDEQKRTYLDYLRRVAPAVRELDADLWVIHDPQPLPLRLLAPLDGPAIWRCHIDASAPNPAVGDWLAPYIKSYDRSVFSMLQYVFGDLPPDRVTVELPAIDPLTPKNRHLPRAEVASVLRRLGIDPRRPLVSQVSRFDPWKNPRQAVDAYRLARREMPELELAMVGVFAAKDDPEGPKIYEQIRAYTADDPQVHLYTDPARVGDREVNAFQSGSTVVLQRSLREGFGLTVTEAMWKARPVIATPVGGITVQIQHGVDGYLVESTEDCAQLLVRLVRQPALAQRVGQAARQRVRERFLLPRLLTDELHIYTALLGERAERAA
ncbi:MAG: glycosyltransferase [Chloroflexi bacterium]|nr:glycosyltransferase [Chloroflexota bacterium]